MSRSNSKLPILAVLAILFTVALTFATLELPLLVDGIIHNYLDKYFYDWTIAQWWWSLLRTIGYASIVVVIALIIVGFKTGREKLSSLGSIAFFLPTFGYFAASMFVLSGIGLLRVLWEPFFQWYDLSLKLGDIAFLPYLLILYPFRLVGVEVGMPLAYLAIGSGIFIFCLGTLTWFYGKSENREIIDFWIYKYSRHPQYLGFIIWSYGVMLFGTLSPDILPGGYLPEPSFPWLISALILISVALTEEIKMTKEANKSYLEYRDSTPFMLPLPKSISKMITTPQRILFKKDFPESGKQILCNLVIYLAILVMLSVIFQALGLNWRYPLEEPVIR